MVLVNRTQTSDYKYNKEFGLFVYVILNNTYRDVQMSGYVYVDDRISPQLSDKG